MGGVRTDPGTGLLGDGVVRIVIAMTTRSVRRPAAQPFLTLALITAVTAKDNV